MSAHPNLNPNQARHVRSYLHLLAEELEVEHSFLPQDPSGDERRHAIDDTHDQINHLLRQLGLEMPVAREPGRRLWALAEMWISRVEELRPRGLAPYGAVADGLGEVLDPAVNRIIRALDNLSRAANRRD